MATAYAELGDVYLREMMGTDIPEFRSQDDAARTRELDLREREVAAKEREVAAKEAEIRRSRLANPLFLALVAATLGVIGNTYVAYKNNQNSEHVERLREQSTLLVDVVRTDDPKQSCKNLIFLVGLGLLDDSNQTILSQCGDEPKGPVTLPLASTPTSLLGLQTQPSENIGHVTDAQTGAPLAEATISSGGVNAVTDANGLFIISFKDGAFFFSITVQKDGYASQTVTAIPGMLNNVRLFRTGSK